MPSDRALRFAFVLLAAPAGAAQVADRVVAVVDRDPVTLSEAREAVALGLYGDGDGTLADAVERLIEFRLMEREARQFRSPPPSPELVDDALRQLRNRFATQEEYRDVLLSLGIREDYLRRRIGRQLAVDHYVDRRFRPQIRVARQQIEDYYRDVLLPDLAAGDAPALVEVEELIRRIIEEREMNRRIDAWLAELKASAVIVRSDDPPGSGRS